MNTVRFGIRTSCGSKLESPSQSSKTLPPIDGSTPTPLTSKVKAASSVSFEFSVTVRVTVPLTVGMNRALALAKNYRVQSVPVVYVDGKFQLSSDKIGSHSAMPGAINQLIAKARSERPKS